MLQIAKSLPVILLFSCLSSTFSINPVLAEEKMLHTLTVTGQGIEQVPTTITQVQLGVEIKGETAEQVQQQVAQKSSAVIEFLRSRQVEELQTTGVSLQPIYDYKNDDNKLIGYIGTNTVSFRLQTDNMGNLLDEAVRAGATKIDSLSFTAEENAIAEAQKQALRKATENAKQQADAVLETLNLRSQEIVGIQVNHANSPIPQPMAMEMMKAADSSTPVVGGKQTVEASVTLQISY
jgi:uncharacterized protein